MLGKPANTATGLHKARLLVQQADEPLADHQVFDLHATPLVRAHGVLDRSLRAHQAVRGQILENPLARLADRQTCTRITELIQFAIRYDDQPQRQDGARATRPRRWHRRKCST